MNNTRDFSGQKIGKLLVLAKTDFRTKKGNCIFSCECECGKQLLVPGGRLSKNLKENIGSCGCYRSDMISKDRKQRDCSKCKKTKYISEFAINNSRKDGHSQYCKECKIEVNRKYSKKYQSNRTLWAKNKRRTDIKFRIIDNLRRRVNSTLKGANKSKDTIELIGCEIEFLKKYLESKFLPGMTWENYGKHGWHIDHIKPCSKFDMHIKSEQQKCFHYTNLQPLWAFDNISKGNKYE